MNILKKVSPPRVNGVDWLLVEVEREIGYGLYIHQSNQLIVWTPEQIKNSISDLDKALVDYENQPRDIIPFPGVKDAGHTD